MELPLPDVPVCKMPHKDEEELMQPADQLSQPPQVVTIGSIIIIIMFMLLGVSYHYYKYQLVFKICLGNISFLFAIRIFKRV